MSSELLTIYADQLMNTIRNGRLRLEPDELHELLEYAGHIVAAEVATRLTESWERDEA